MKVIEPRKENKRAAKRQEIPPESPPLELPSTPVPEDLKELVASTIIQRCWRSYIVSRFIET